MAIGWIKLHRKIQECAILWDSNDEPFDKRSAWIDLLLLANHQDKRIFFRGKAITVGCGQRITSLHKLAERWHWGINRTRNYLDLLQSEGMITRESDNTKTLLTIVNYQKYQGFSDIDDTPTDTVTDTPIDTVMNTPSDIAQIQSRIQSQIPNKNDKECIKNEKNDKEGTTTPTPYQEIMDMYNEICVSYPSIRNLSDARKKAIKARLKTYDLNDFRLLFYKAEESDFLKGKNKNNWSATFDWLICDSNMAKVLDGNYENKKSQGQSEFDDYANMLKEWVAKSEEAKNE